MHKHYKSINQRGFVSITVTIIIMIVVTLIVSSFALVVRREQRRSLDRQLSAQAFYAAEAGAQDAVVALDKIPSLQTDICQGNDSFLGKTANDPTNPMDFDPKVNSNTEYTCVLISNTVDEWKVDSVHPEDGGFVVPIETSGLNRIKISWQEANGNSGIDSYNNFNLPKSSVPPTVNTLKQPLLKVVLMPGFNGSSLSRSDFVKNSQTLYLYPNKALHANTPSTVAYKGNSADEIDAGQHPGQGNLVNGNCNADSTPKKCSVSITGVTDQKWYLYIQPLYQPLSISMQGLDPSGGSLPLANAQTLIDVTGRSADVLRRIQVRKPIGEGSRLRNYEGLMPPGALVTEDDICKLWQRTLTEATTTCPGEPTPVTL